MHVLVSYDYRSTPIPLKLLPKYRKVGSYHRLLLLICTFLSSRQSISLPPVTVSSPFPFLSVSFLSLSLFLSSPALFQQDPQNFLLLQHIQ